ncbi:hypothetical protein K438DRAFT_931339 [Mycena galopus ATCC 62051]|nr:hypothetical protein K438DRAFT_931339 [Mycena galopus ATCC 62051]
MSTRPADSNSRSFPHPPHVPPSRTVDLPEPPSNPSSFRSPSYLSASYVPNGISTNHLPNVSPSSLGYSPTTEEEDDPSGGGDSSDSPRLCRTLTPTLLPRRKPIVVHGGSSRSSVYSHVYPERTSSTGPPFQAAPSPVAAGGDSHSSAYSHSEWTPGTDPPPVASSRSSTYSYTYATASHPPAVPISIPPRSRTPEDDPSVAYSAGEFSRWGTPQREPRGNSFTDSLRGAGSFSFQDDAIAAKREREDRERAQAREREDQERVQERERQEKQEERERALDAERIARLAEEAERKAEEVKRKEEAAQKKEQSWFVSRRRRKGS